MRIVLLGAPGVGKGTQAYFLTKKCNIPHISISKILNNITQSQSHLSKEINTYIKIGKLIKDEIVINLIKQRLHESDCYNGFILDGFPRTIVQANAIKKSNIVLDFILELSLPDNLIIERIIGRRTHLPSGRVYHIKFHPPIYKDKDDITGDKLTIREDDKKDVVRQRILEYHRQTKPLIDYYHKESNIGRVRYIVVDVNRNIIDINKHLINVLGIKN